MGQVIQRRERGAVGQPWRGLDDARLAARATVGDLEHSARLAAKLARHRLEVGGINHRAAGQAVAGSGPAGRWTGRYAGCRRWSATATCTTDRLPPTSAPARRAPAQAPPHRGAAAPDTGCRPASRSPTAPAPGPR